MRLAIAATSLAACLVPSFAAPAAAQTNLRAWNRDGQTWLVWEDDQTFVANEHYAVYRSTAPIADVNDAGVVLVGRLYPQDWSAARLKYADPTATWTVPDAIGGSYTLLANEAVFAYTPHAAVAEHFAVVKGVFPVPITIPPAGATVGPVTQTLDPVVPHVQLTGSDLGHAYTVYALWIDGGEDLTAALPNYPILANEHQNGTAALFAVFEPTTGPPPPQAPAVIFLHGGGVHFWTFRPSKSADHLMNLHVQDGYYVTVDDNMFVYRFDPAGSTVQPMITRWFGYCDSFDRFELTSDAPAPGAVVNDYTLRKLDWILGWLSSELDVDPERIAMMGHSNGGRGTLNYARSRPEALSAGTAFVPPLAPEISIGHPAMWGDPADNLPTNLPGAVGINDYLYPATTVSDVDLPFLRIIHGTDDASVSWADIPPLYDELDALRWGAAIYWDEREHANDGTGGWIGAHFAGSQRHSAPWLTQYQSDRSYPAFHGVDHAVLLAGAQPDPGDPIVPANGNPWGTWGGWFEWDDATLVDTADLWSVELGLVTASAFPADLPPLPQATASVTIRRAQQFHPPVHEPLQWRQLNSLTSGLIAAGSAQVDASGRITVPDLSFGLVPAVLEVRRAALAPLPFEYGSGTPGCAGLADIGFSMLPQVGASGFDFTCTNAPPSGYGAMALGVAPQDLSALGIGILVDVIGPHLLLPAHADAVGIEFTPLGIPNDPALIGQVFYAQYAWLDACGPLGFSASRGLAVPILP